MDQPVELVPLVCLRCAARLPARVGEVAWVCGQCGQAQQLDEARGLAELLIEYAAGLNPEQPGWPFWVFEAQVQVNRQARSQNHQINQEAQIFWSAPRRFYAPAWECSFEDLLKLASDLLLNPPALEAGKPAPFLPVTLEPADLQAIAEFIVTAIEAGRKDSLRKLEMNVQLAEPVLWILP